MIFLEDINQVTKNHPGLEFNSDQKTLIGTIEIGKIQPGIDKVLDTYKIKIHIDFGYPLVLFPKVFELNSKVPIEPRRHINPDGSFCLSVRPKEFLICRQGLTLTKFIDDIVIPFLAVQTLFNEDLIDKFPQGEYDHGGKGILEYYQAFFKITDPKIILEGFRIIFRNKISRNSPCFCGKNKKTKRCHLETLYQLKSYPKALLRLDYKDLKSTILH